MVSTYPGFMETIGNLRLNKVSDATGCGKAEPSEDPGGSMDRGAFYMNHRTCRRQVELKPVR